MSRGADAAQCWLKSRTIYHPNPVQTESTRMYFTHYCFASDGFQLVFSGFIKMWKLSCNFRIFSAELESGNNEPRGNNSIKKENESALIYLRKVIEKSWNFRSGFSSSFSGFLSSSVFCIRFLFVCNYCMYFIFFPNTTSKPHHL